jgi:nucleoid-associated protein YgaU
MVTYIVKPGDTLFGIAQKFLKDGNKWPHIYNRNKHVIGPDPNLIYPGQRLTFQV